VVYVPEHVHESGLTLLAGHAEVLTGFGPAARPLDDVLDQVTGIVLRTQPLTADHFARAPRLEIVARHGVGTDNVDLAAASRHGVLVTNTPDANTGAVAEHVFALLLGLQRKLVQADQVVRTGTFDGRAELIGTGLRGKRLGVLGLGRIGRRVAHIAEHGFGMRVHPHDRNAPLARFLAECDVLSVHIPATPETVNLLGPAELDLLPEHAVVIATSRGGVVDENALAERLAAGRLAGAGLDVFAAEPPAGSPLLSLPNVILSPHIAAQTHEALEVMSTTSAEAVISVLRGKYPSDVVNAEFLDHPDGRGTVT
jgi:D-3-phosphoglycerate dehydrogenase